MTSTNITGQHGLLRAPGVACADVLRHERRHRLHQCARHEHDEVDDFARDAVAGGRRQTQTVDERAQREEGQLRQEFLKRERQTDGQKAAALLVQADVALRDGERQVLAEQDNGRTHDADRLREHGCDCRARRVQMQTGNQNEVARHVHQTRHEHEQQRRTAVAQTAEHRREQVVRDDEPNAAAADAHIARC